MLTIYQHPPERVVGEENDVAPAGVGCDQPCLRAEALLIVGSGIPREQRLGKEDSHVHAPLGNVEGGAAPLHDPHSLRHPERHPVVGIEDDAVHTSRRAAEFGFLLPLRQGPAGVDRQFVTAL